MARILPDELDAARARGTAVRELETLEHLESALPDEYTVFHGVHWARADDNGSVYGEIDFLVVNRYGRVLAIEQKNGRLEVVGNELVKTYSTGPKSVRAQVTRNIQHLRAEFGRRHPGKRLDVDHLLYCPDDDVRGRLPMNIAVDRVVDAASARHVADRILTLFERSPMSGGDDAADASDVFVFLSELVDVAPNVDALHGLAAREFARLSGGLTTWAQRLSMSPFRLRVLGTAGSGKTQLALEELRRAHRDGKAAMYVCFNRSLADSMRRAAPAASACTTFHELGAWIVRASGGTIDYGQPSVFDRLAGAVVAAAPDLRESVDLLIVDEGQDFEPEWAQAILQLARPDGRCLWLEDPDQNLYRRDRVALPDWVTLTSPVCYRAPRVIVTLINMLALSDAPLQAGSAVHGFDPTLHRYDDDGALPARIDEAVGALLDAGHAPQDIVVLSWRGMNASAVVGLEAIAGRRTRRFTGQYTADGDAVHSDGEIVVETVHRFKGQSADCVVLAGVDFGAWEESVRRRLFVAMTRARLKLALVVSREAEAAILERLQQPDEESGARSSG